LNVYQFPLNHPQGASGYRIEKDGAVIVHASDVEHGEPRMDSILREHAQNADVLIMDAQYTPEEYESKRGWGHTTWLEATRVARDCGVKQLVLFHHDPGHDDRAINEILACAQRQFENTVAAKEGWVCGV
jgi:ribonuclease BN (tRNA processing enzyme)